MWLHQTLQSCATLCGHAKNIEKRQYVRTAKGTTYKCQNQAEITVKMANKLTY